MSTEATTTIRTFADAQRRLAETLPGYEERAEQAVLAEAIERFIADHAEFDPDDPEQGPPTHLLGQAGTGTGKALGYAIPAVLSGKRVIISVTTKNLQGQLSNKDLPFLEENLGVPFTWSVLKGRAAYLCLTQAVAGSDVPLVLPSILAYAKENPDWDGSREDLPIHVSGSEWSRICSEADACRESGCKSRAASGDDSCYAERARRKALASSIVVVNHALLCTDLSIRAEAGARFAGMLGAYDLIVLDEAHEFEKIAGETIGTQLREGTFRSLANETRSWVRRYQDDEDVVEAVERAGGLVTAAAAELFDATPTRGHPDGLGLPVGRVRLATLEENLDMISKLSAALRQLHAAWRTTTLETVATEDYYRAKNRHGYLSGRVVSTTKRYEALFLEDPDLVRWVSTEPARSGKVKVINTCPVSLAPFLAQHLFARTPVALVSATLATGGRFDYVTGRLGIDEHRSLDVGTPFDYATQSRLYIAGDLPLPPGGGTRRDGSLWPEAEEWEAAVVAEIEDLVRASRGRALVLFSNLKQMQRAATVLRRTITQPLLVQGDLENKVLGDRFKAEADSVLLGSNSFGTGFDVQGEALSLLVVTKLAFPMPKEPLVEARCERIDRDHGDGASFGKYSLPIASLTLQQWTGRLIRSKQDRGLVAILDSRMAKKGYRHQLIRDMPSMTRVDRDAALEYLAGI